MWVDTLHLPAAKEATVVGMAGGAADATLQVPHSQRQDGQDKSEAYFCTAAEWSF